MPTVPRCIPDRHPASAVRAVALLPMLQRPLQPLPKIVAFDLDGTLWYPEMYQLRWEAWGVASGEWPPASRR